MALSDILKKIEQKAKENIPQAESLTIDAFRTLDNSS